MTYKNGDYYEGEWLCDMRHGRGLYQHLLPKDSYTGEWSNDSKTGKGTYSFR